jgi:hypothetical protein
LLLAIGIRNKYRFHIRPDFQMIKFEHKDRNADSPSPLIYKKCVFSKKRFGNQESGIRNPNPT